MLDNETPEEGSTSDKSFKAHIWADTTKKISTYIKLLINLLDFLSFELQNFQIKHSENQIVYESTLCLV